MVRVEGEDIEPLAELGRLSFDVRLGPGEERAVRVSVVLEEDSREVRLGRSAPLYGEAPALETGWEALRRSWERSVEDLGSLPFDAGRVWSCRRRGRRGTWRSSGGMRSSPGIRRWCWGQGRPGTL